MKITICILTHNRCHILKLLLQSLKELKENSNVEIQIIVIDNGSTDATYTVKRYFPEITYLRMPKNIGVSARNFGFRKAEGDIIISLDDDILGLKCHHVSWLVEYFSMNPQVGAINFKIIDSKTRNQCNWIHHQQLEKFKDKDFFTYEISEGAVAFNRKVLEQAGYYCEYFFLSHEGPDLAFRIIECGFEVRYSPFVVVEHSHSNLGRKSWFRYYYDTRNQFFLAMRNFPVGYGIKYLIRGIGSTFFYSVRDGCFRYWLKGMRDGLFGMRKIKCERKVLSRKTMHIIREIDKTRAPILSIIGKKMRQKSMRL